LPPPCLLRASPFELGAQATIPTSEERWNKRASCPELASPCSLRRSSDGLSSLFPIPWHFFFLLLALASAWGGVLSLPADECLPVTFLFDQVRRVFWEPRGALRLSHSVTNEGRNGVHFPSEVRGRFICPSSLSRPISPSRLSRTCTSSREPLG